MGIIHSCCDPFVLELIEMSKLNVDSLCDAYDLGFGHSMKNHEQENPYSQYSFEYQAYVIGYREGMKSKKKS